MADKRNDERTDEEVMKKKQTNIRKRMALEKEEKEAEMEVRKKERAIPHSAKDEPYFAQKYLGSSSVASMRCPCGHTVGEHAVHERARALPGGPMQGAVDRVLQVQHRLSFQERARRFGRDLGAQHGHGEAHGGRTDDGHLSRARADRPGEAQAGA